MIFVTVGTDLPFDRMVKVVDQWAFDMDRKDVFAQIGAGGWEPRHLEYTHFLQPDEYVNRIVKCDIVISHAGMGTILTALQYGKKIIIMPKLSKLNEHRNDHQFATAKAMSDVDNVNVALDEVELRTCLENLDQIRNPSKISNAASNELVSAIRNFLYS
jgi:UDP-N-acetylglucosamine transferase subunit ALG13